MPLVSRKFYKQTLRTKDKSTAICLALKGNSTVEAEWDALLKASGVTTETGSNVEEAIAFLSAQGLAPGDGSKDFGGVSEHELFEMGMPDPAYGSAPQFDFLGSSLLSLIL